jgi:DNA-binding transcriptional MerR regulator/predicted transcriptional regulator YdeE
MEPLVTIGEFARLSHLSVKALRHYHDVGLLTPAAIDSSGYRRYGPAQVQQAQLVRRLRLLEMPLPDIKAVLAAPDEQSRDATIADHLQRMEETLGRTAEVVASLRDLLRPQARPLAVEYRTVPAVPVLGIRAEVDRADVSAWCATTFPRLVEALAVAALDPAGPAGATYSSEFFEKDRGEILAFVPLAHQGPGFGGVEALHLSAGRFAVAVHSGPFEDIDRSYGALGSHVAAHNEPEPLPIRELYLLGPTHTQDRQQFRTEIWWPIRQSNHSN